MNTYFEIPGRYWLAYIRGRTGRKHIQDSGSLFTIATRESSAHLWESFSVKKLVYIYPNHLSAVILLSVAFIDSPKLWPWVSVAATSSKLEWRVDKQNQNWVVLEGQRNLRLYLENVGPGQSIETEIPVPIFSVRRDSKYPCNAECDEEYSALSFSITKFRAVNYTLLYYHV